MLGSNDPRTWHSCQRCNDGGQELFRCDGGTGNRGSRDAHLRLAPCGRRFPHAPHSYADRCACVETNPVIAARRLREQQRKDAA